jgi:RNA polymerase sigma-70 factor (ECF subfamily)
MSKQFSSPQHSRPASMMSTWQDIEIMDNSAGEISEGRLSLHHLLSLCLRSRDELLWTEFIRRSQPVISGVVIKTMRRWIRPTPSLVDDLVQETYLKLFANKARALRRFVCHHQNALYGFLKVVASNTVQDHFRCSYSKKRGSGHEAESIDPAGMEHADARTFEERRIGRTAWAVSANGLPYGLEHRILFREIDVYLKTRASEPCFVRDYTIFWLYYREGLTAKAISRVPLIGLTVKGVESTLLRLTRLVRKRLEQRPNGLRSVPPRMHERRMQPAK